MGSAWCPRCGSELIAPSAFDSSWRCPRDGRTLPLTEYHHLDADTIRHIRTHSEVPLWFPDPVPPGWRLAGLASVGDSRSNFRATVAAFQGPAPLGGTGEWLFVAEEPGIGLGSGYVGRSEAADWIGPLDTSTSRTAATRAEVRDGGSVDTAGSDPPPGSGPSPGDPVGPDLVGPDPGGTPAHAGRGRDPFNPGGLEAQPVRISVRGHSTPIWPVTGVAPNLSAYRGEAAGVWLWVIGLPADAGYAVLDDLGVTDMDRHPIEPVPPAARSRLLRPGSGDR